MSFKLVQASINRKLWSFLTKTRQKKRNVSWL